MLHCASRNCQWILGTLGTVFVLWARVPSVSCVAFVGPYVDTCIYGFNISTEESRPGLRHLTVGTLRAKLVLQIISTCSLIGAESTDWAWLALFCSLRRVVTFIAWQLVIEAS